MIDLTFNDAHLNPPQTPLDTRDVAAVKLAIWHHTDGSPYQTVFQIDYEHRYVNRWLMIGYHAVITYDGKIWLGRPWDAVPAAAEGANTDSVDVALTGDFQPDTPGFAGGPSAAQLDSVLQLSIWLHQKFPTIEDTWGHRDVAEAAAKGDPRVYLKPGTTPSSLATECCGDVFYKYVKNVLPEETRAALAKLGSG